MGEREMTVDIETRQSKSKGVCKTYVFALGIVVFALLITAITSLVLYLEKPADLIIGNPETEYCTEPDCPTAANSFMRSINTNVNPCDDFYEFACGSWNQTNPMPEERGSWGVFDVLRVELSRTLKSLLEKDEADALDVIKKMRRYYGSCVNEDAIEAAGVAPFNEIFMSVFPQAVNFPFKFENAPSVPQIFAAFTEARKFGLTLGVMTNGVSSNPDNSRVNLINFDVGSLPMERAFYLKEQDRTEIAAYKKYLEDMFQLFARKLSKTFTAEQASRAADDLIEFETFWRSRLTPEERRDPMRLRNKMTITEFAQDYTSLIEINADMIVTYFDKSWNLTQQDALSVNTTINVAEPEYYRLLATRLAEQVLTPSGRSSFGNYVVWQIARAYVGRLAAEFRNISEEFSAALRGVSIPAPRWESCVNTVNNEFPNAIGRLYVQDNFKKSTKAELEEMIIYIFDAFREMIGEAEWMTPETKRRALIKSENFTSLVGYEDYIVDDNDRLNREHADFTPTDSYLGNVFSMQRLAVKEEGKSLLTVTTPPSWITGAAVVNAFYAPYLNSISFPAGILQPPFLGADYPKYWNFGAIGTVIGHELTHGFDNRGAQYDENGDLTNWWDEKSLTEFTKRGDAMRAQYSQYSLMGVQMNGYLTIGENIADNGGLKNSFRGYRAYIKSQNGGKPEPRLRNLSFSPEQLFFLANSQVWCSDFRLKDLESQVRTGAHSPGRFRVIGPLQNFDEFSKAFSCPVGSYMNPEKKNIVW